MVSFSDFCFAATCAMNRTTPKGLQSLYKDAKEHDAGRPDVVNKYLKKTAKSAPETWGACQQPTEKPTFCGLLGHFCTGTAPAAADRLLDDTKEYEQLPNAGTVSKSAPAAKKRKQMATPDHQSFDYPALGKFCSRVCLMLTKVS